MRINSGNIGAIAIGIGLVIVWIIYWLITQQEKQKDTTGAGASGTGGSSLNTGVGTPSTLAMGSYIVQVNDTLGKIAAQYNTTVAALIAKNGLVTNLTYPKATALLMKSASNPNLIYVGQALKV